MRVLWPHGVSQLFHDFYRIGRPNFVEGLHAPVPRRRSGARRWPRACLARAGAARGPYGSPTLG
jgi:hypothetical protein